MSAPRTTDSYPPEFLAAIHAAHSAGEFIIPTPNPAALRLRLNGLRGAMRKEGKSELVDMVSFFLQAEPPAVIIRLRAIDPLVGDVAAALANPINPTAARVEQEDILARLLGEKA